MLGATNGSHLTTGILAGLSGYVAEIGAAFLCAALGMEPTEREDHAAYIENWLGALRKDKRAIFQAATAAQAASNFILSAMAPADIERAAA